MCPSCSRLNLFPLLYPDQLPLEINWLDGVPSWNCRRPLGSSQCIFVGYQGSNWHNPLELSTKVGYWYPNPT